MKAHTGLAGYAGRVNHRGNESPVAVNVVTAIAARMNGFTFVTRSF